MKRKIFLGALLLSVVIAISWAVYGDKDTNDVITIGAPLPLSGSTASLAERVKIAMEIALLDKAAKSKFKYKLKFEDTKGEAKTAILVTNKIIEVDRSKLIVGLLKSDALLSVAPITEKKKVIVVSPTAGAQQITTAGDYVFRTIEGPNIHGNAMSGFLLDKGANSVALLVANASNAKSYGDSFKESFSSVGNVDIELRYDPSRTDFRTEISKVLNVHTDAVYVAVATAKDGGIIVKQLREQGFEGPIALSVAAEAQEFFDAAGKFSESVYITASYYDKDDDRFSEFRESFLSASGGREAGGFSANGYDSVSIVIDAVEECGGVEAECIRDYLYNLQDHVGLGGTLSFDQNGDVLKPVLIKQAREGSFEIVR